MYIDTGSSMPISPSKSCDLTDENNKIFDGMEMIRNNFIYKKFSMTGQEKGDLLIRVTA